MFHCWLLVVMETKHGESLLLSLGKWICELGTPGSLSKHHPGDEMSSLFSFSQDGKCHWWVPKISPLIYENAMDELAAPNGFRFWKGQCLFCDLGRPKLLFKSLGLRKLNENLSTFFQASISAENPSI